ncbi:MAG: VOC family protein [Cyanobacteria bacterium P01_A01_bin.135]
MGLTLYDAFVAIAAPDLDSVVAFYQALLDQPPQPHAPGRYAEFQLSGLRLGLFTPKADHAAQFVNSDGAALSLCLEVKDLEAAIAHLEVTGHPPIDDIAVTSHGREAYAYDPTGTRLILHEARKPS